MVFQHFQTKKYGFFELENDRVQFGEGESVRIQSESVRACLRRLVRKDPYAEKLKTLAVEISHSEDLQRFLYWMLDANCSTIAEINDLEKAVLFYRKHPTWWEQNVEAHFEALSDSIRQKIPEGFDRDRFDITVGIAQGTYGFGKDLVVAIPALLSLFPKLFEAQTYTAAWQIGKEATTLYFLLNYGTFEQKKQAFTRIQELGKEIFKTVSEHFSSEWDEAEKDGKQTQLVSKWVARGVLEVATVALAVVKGAQVAKQARVLASGAEVAEKLEAAEKAALVGQALSQAESRAAVMATNTRAVQALAKAKAKAARARRLKNVTRVERMSAEKLLRSWYLDHPGIRYAKREILRSHILGSSLKKRVRKIKLRNNQILEQWVRIGGKPGIYCTNNGANPAQLGIRTQNRIRMRWKVIKPHFAIETMVKEFKPGKIAGVGGDGGEIQYIMRPDWERYVVRIE
ncbi:MAG: hypothetical protein HY537_01905 [Deltaproteobacteria bacterium]|nr:hypothetical protein [Deltaproteobacteria bacterium]